MPPVIVGIAAGIAAAGVVSTAAAIAIGIGAAALTYAATPKFDGGSFANEAFTQQQMLRSPVEPRRGIYGRAMVSGPLVFAEETGADNAYLHLVIPLAGHRCDGVEKIYFGDDVAWANGALTSKYASVARLKVHLGNQTTSDPDLTAECRQWTLAHVGFGVTYLYARLKFDTKVFPNGVPNIKALVRGKQVYDPRKNTHNWEEPTTWEWSDNWALCCLDYNRFESGVGAAAHEIDVSYFAAAANDSDQLVEYKTGKFEKRYTCNGTYNQDVSPSSIMEKMLTAGAGMHVYVSGQYRLYAGVYQGPEVLVLTEDDAAGDIDVRPYTPRAELCNAVRGTFVDPENFYQPTDFPPYESSYYRAHDDGEYIDHDLDLPFTQSVWTAQRLGKLYLEQKRAGMQISMPVKMIGVAVSVGKVVGLSLPRLGIDGTFQIVDWQFDYGKPVSLILIETSAELFDYAMGSYTERDLTPNVILPNPATVPTPIGLQYVEYQDDPQWQGQLTWSAPANNSSYRYVIEVSNGLGDVVYQTNADATRSMLPKLDTGFYTVSLWALNLFANRSNVPATLTIGATLPAPVIGIAVIAGPLTLTLRPTTAAQIAQTTQFEILGSITNNIAEAALIGTGKDAVWPDRHPNTRYHVWARTINNYGVSSWYGPVEATTSADNTSIIDLIGNTFKNYTWFAWADDASGTGFTTVEANGDGKAYMGIAPDKPTASPSGNWQDYTWSKINAVIPPVFTPEEEAKLDNLMAGKLPFAPDKDMLAAQDALNNPALANNLITALSLLNQGINAPALGGETPASAQAKADAAKNAANKYTDDNSTGVNLLKNSAFLMDTIGNTGSFSNIPGWEGWTNQISGPIAVDVWRTGDWALVGGATALLLQSSSGTGTTNKDLHLWSDKIPVSAGKHFAFSGYFGAHGCSGALFCFFYNSSNELLFQDSQLISYLDGFSGGKTLSGYKRLQMIATAPANVSYVRVGIRKFDTDIGLNQSYLFFTKIAVCEVNAGATVAPPWVPGLEYTSDVQNSNAIAAAAIDASNKANNAKSQAEANAALDALNKSNSAQLAAQEYALAKANLAEVTAKSYADGKVSIEESRAIADAQAKADAAKQAAINAASVDATSKSNSAQLAAQEYALAKANLAEVTAKSYADGKVTDEESRAIADAQAKADAAKLQAIAIASEDARSKINAIKIGGTNLVDNSIINIDSIDYGFGGRTVNLIAGREYVFSAAGYCTQLAIEQGHFLASILYFSDWSFAKGLNNYSLTESTTYASFIAPVTGVYYIASYCYPSDGVRTGTVHSSWYKVEEGNKPSAWSPSHNDLNDYALAKANLAEVTAKAYADGKVTNEELRAIADAQAKADAAKNAANKYTDDNSTGVNLLKNSAFLMDTLGNTGSFSNIPGWEGWTNQISGPIAVDVWRTGDWALVGGATALLLQSSSGTGTTNKDLHLWSDKIPVSAGKHFAFSGYFGAHGCSGALFCFFYNSSNELLFQDYQLISYLDGFSGGKTLSGYKRLQMIATAPANVSYVRVGIRKFDTDIGHPQSYLFFTKIAVCEVNAGATVAPPWVPGLEFTSDVQNSNAVTQAVSNISAGLFEAQIGIISTLIANSALFNELKSKLGAFGGLTAETIASLAIATNHLQAGAVTADKVTADTALVQKLIANVGLFNQLQAQLAMFGGISANSIATNAINSDKLAVNDAMIIKLIGDSGLFNSLKARIGAFGGLTANEIQADTALINKLVGTSGLFNDLAARLAVFGGLTANSIAADAILGRHIKAGEKITSPIIEGGELRLIGTAYMKVQSASAFGPDGLVEWYGPKLLVNGVPDWANLRKSNAITYLAANGDAYFGGSLSAGVLKTGVTNTDKNPYAANSYPVTIGPFGSNGKAKTVVVSFALSAYSQNPTNPNNPTQPQLSWQLQRKIGSGSWATVSSGVFNGTTSADFEAEPPAHWLVRETCWGSFTFTDNTNSTSDFNYRVLVISYSRYHATSNVNTHNLSLISTEQ
ncbi:hypothetical protein L5M51_18715 [Shewanella sp. SM73]|uniref:phage tail tip protein J-related protein n=1 Tax=Shewanella sp. SM73 TaxID=2912806 RepID=UPI0021DAC529|nr:hypothetical protein [Shewanella sp. SM73]MCU8031769.1 hypothetical protein [Shewanella sp. SM73]